MKKIPLTKGQFAIVDDEDFEFLMQWKWQSRHQRNKVYAGRTKHTGQKNGAKWVRDSIIMHRLIIRAPEGMEVDHIDGNGLNNQKSNLRLATRSENSRNTASHKDAASKYKGVSLFGRDQIWVANIYANGKQNYLGRFKTEEEAAEIYNREAVKYFGRFAKLNEVADGAL